MGDLHISLRRLERIIDAVRQETRVTALPHLLKASVDSATTTLNQGVVLSQMERRGEDVKKALEREEVEV